MVAPVAGFAKFSGAVGESLDFRSTENAEDGYKLWTSVEELAVVRAGRAFMGITHASYLIRSWSRTSGDTRRLLIFVHLASAGISFPCSSGASLNISGFGLVPNTSPVLLGFLLGIEPEPVRAGMVPYSVCFFRSTIDRKASSSPKDP